MDPIYTLCSIFQNGRSIEDYVSEFLTYCHLAPLDDAKVKDCFWMGLDQEVSFYLPDVDPECTLAQYLDFVLLFCGSLFTVGEAEPALHASPAKPARHASPAEPARHASPAEPALHVKSAETKAVCVAPAAPETVSVTPAVPVTDNIVPVTDNIVPAKPMSGVDDFSDLPPLIGPDEPEPEFSEPP